MIWDSMILVMISNHNVMKDSSYYLFKGDYCFFLQETDKTQATDLHD